MKFFLFITQGSSVEKTVKEFTFSNTLEFLDRLRDSVIKNAPLFPLKKKENFWNFLKLHRARESGTPQRKECTRLRIVDCGDETPTAMYNTTHIRKKFRDDSFVSN